MTNEEFDLYEVVFEFGKGFFVNALGHVSHDVGRGLLVRVHSKMRVRAVFNPKPLDDDGEWGWPTTGWYCFAKGESDIPRAKQEIHERLCARMRGCKEELDRAAKDFRSIQADVSEAAKGPDLYVRMKEQHNG